MSILSLLTLIIVGIAEEERIALEAKEQKMREEEEERQRVLAEQRRLAEEKRRQEELERLAFEAVSNPRQVI